MSNIPSTGPISFSKLRVDFGDTNASSFSEFYKGGGKVLSTVDGDTINSNVPTTGAISLSNFYSAKGYFVHTISADAFDVDAVSVLTSAGWDGKQPVYLIIDTGVYVYGYPRNAVMAPALSIANNSSNPYFFTIKNKGYILGAGGTDRTSRSPTEAIKCTGTGAVHLTIKNTSYINGGGGAGKQIVRQVSSNSAQYYGGAGGGAGGGHGDELSYFNGSTFPVSIVAAAASGVVGANGRLGTPGEGSDTNLTSGNAYPLTGGRHGGAGGGLYNGIQVGGAQGGSIPSELSYGVYSTEGNWSTYSGTINLAAGGYNGGDGSTGPLSSFNQFSSSSGAFGAGAGGSWGADGGAGRYYFWNGTVTTQAGQSGAKAINNLSTGGSTSIESGLGGTIYGDVV